MKTNIETKYHIMAELSYDDVNYLYKVLRNGLDGETEKERQIRSDIWHEMEQVKYHFEHP